MMLKIYDENHNAVGQMWKIRDLTRESELDTGEKTLTFTYLSKKRKLKEEYYIRDKENEYVVKQVERSTDGFQNITATLNLEELEGMPWQKFSAKNATIAEAARLAIAGTGWRVGECNVTKRRNTAALNTTALGVIDKLCTAFICERVYDTINKTVSFYEAVGEDKGVYFLRSLNLRKLSAKSDSYDFYTSIFPVGKNGMTIESVNNGSKYLENYSYSSKKKTYLWTDDSYDDPQALLEDAELKLEDLAKPASSYSAEIWDLAKCKPGYSILSFSLGDTITLIDNELKIREKQRIKKITEYLQEPEKNTCELGNTFLTFAEMQQKVKDATAVIETAIDSEGNTTGTITTDQILGFSDAVSGNSTVQEAAKGNLKIEGELTAVSARVGTIETNYIKAEEADLKYANIDLANIKKGSITTAMIGTGVVGTAQIADSSITDAKIVELTANKITAGTLSVERLEIRGSTNSIVYGLNNITGALQAQSVDTLNGEILTPRTITADKIVAQSITGNEIAAKTILANNIDVMDLFAQEITATGTIRGANLVGATGEFSGCIKATSGKIACLDISEEQMYASFSNGTQMDYCFSKSYFVASAITDNGETRAYFYADTEKTVPGINGRAVIFGNDRVDIRTNGGIYFAKEGAASLVEITADGNLLTAGNIEEAGLLLSEKYAEKSHKHDWDEITNKPTSIASADVATHALLPRVGTDVNANGRPAANRAYWREYNSGCSYLPSAHWYHIFTAQGSDDNYTTQLALGMGTDKMAYRRRASGTWGDWREVPLLSKNGDLTVPAALRPTSGIYDENGNTNTTTNLNYACYVTSNSRIARYASSSKRYKHDITETFDVTCRPEALYDLPVVTYRYNDGYCPDEPHGEKLHIGFIAEDVDRLFSAGCGYRDGVPENWNIMEIVPGMMKLIQNQHSDIIKQSTRQDAAETRMESLQYQLQQAFAEIAALKRQLQAAQA